MGVECPNSGTVCPLPKSHNHLVLGADGVSRRGSNTLAGTVAGAGMPSGLRAGFAGEALPLAGVWMPGSSFAASATPWRALARAVSAFSARDKASPAGIVCRLDVVLNLGLVARREPCSMFGNCGTDPARR